jgi:hypothetical protein
LPLRQDVSGVRLAFDAFVAATEYSRLQCRLRTEQ